MRADPISVEYCRQVNKYNALGMPVPDSIENTYRVWQSIDQVQRTLCKYASDGAIPKLGWQWMGCFTNEVIPGDIPANLSEAARRAKEVIVSLKTDLTQKSEKYLIDGYTVTKAGRKRLRSASEEIRLICKELL